MITVKYQGGFGNKLWQYAVARVLAQKLGLFLMSPGISGLENCPRIIPGKIILKPHLELHGHYLPTDLEPQRISLKGYFERFEHIAPYMSQINSWFQSKSESPKIASNALTVSIRRGSNNWPVETHCPDLNYYLTKIPELGFKEHYICTDAPEDPFIVQLSNEISNSKIIKSDPLSQFTFIQNSSNIFLAPSTFSWWAAMTSKAENIFWPQIPALDFSQTNHDWFPTSFQKMVLI
jgi:hypothetical protein